MWLAEACKIADPLPVLRLALHALAASRIADMDKDAVLAGESLVSHGQALKLLRELLSEPQSVFEDQIMAAVRCLMIYEVRSAQTDRI